MAIVGGLDVHRGQITFDWVSRDSGEVTRGRICPADRAGLRSWLSTFDGEEAAFAVEGCTGWRYVAEELERAGMAAHVAEPTETAGLKGNKKRAKTDRADAQHLRELLADGRIPESWIPPAHVLDVRALGRLYVDMAKQRRVWQQRIKAQLFHHGVPAEVSVLGPEGSGVLAGLELSLSGRYSIETALGLLEGLDAKMAPLRARLNGFARRQKGCRALMRIYGVGALNGPLIWAELGDTRRFASSRQAVRYTGLDITVHSSDGKRSRGHLARQGPPVLRWALFEAALCAARPSSPDHEYYLAVKERLGNNRACLSVARKLARRAHHVLRDLADDAWEPVAV
jgi:transposase